MKSTKFAFGWGQDNRNTNSHTSQLISNSYFLAIITMLLIVPNVNLGVAVLLFGYLVSLI